MLIKNKFRIGCILALGLAACGDDTNGTDGSGSGTDSDGSSGCEGHTCPPEGVTGTMKVIDADGTFPEHPDSFAVLTRTDDSISADVTLSGLPPGEVWTVWWVFHNVTDGCANPLTTANGDTSVCSIADFGGHPQDTFGIATPVPMGGMVVPANGVIEFTGLEKMKVAADFVEPLNVVGPGIVDPMGAEVHIVMQTHGPELPAGAERDSQFSTYNGGCLEGETNEGLCKDLYFALFPVVAE